MPRNGLLRGLLALLSLCGLGVLLVLPLGWQQQGALGIALTVVAILLNGASRSATITLALVTLSIFCTLRYGYWRVTQTWEGITSSGHLHNWDTLCVLLLLFAEFYAFAALVLGYFQTICPLRRTPVALPRDAQQWPTVDVFIPTYNEPLSVVRATVLASLAMDYPADKMRVFVLDDGRREEFSDFAAKVGVNYIARDNNQHAKAGNINFALSQTSGEYVAIFDSDHVPTSSFLQTTLGWFLRDAQLALVQTPHHFYSPDPFERNLGQFRKVPNEGELFHRLVQDGNDLWNASFFCGSCAVLRREALNEIGGIAVETVTEDAHTALRLQRRGWNTAYLNIPQAAGLATESLAAHIGQRIRWARGMVQILRLENPLFVSGLTFSQRLCYFNATTHFLFAVPRLIFLTVPLLYLLFGFVNIYGYSLAVFAYALPHIVLSNLTSSRIQGRYRFSFWSEVYEAVLAPYILLPTLFALISPRLGKFNVTAKGGIIRRSHFDRRMALPFLLLLMLNVAGLYMGTKRYRSDSNHRDTVIMNSVWTVYNVVILSVAASVAWERRQRRSQVRVDLRTPFVLTAPNGKPITGMTRQISLRGASGKLDSRIRLARGTPVRITLGDRRSPCEIQALVAHSAGRRQHLLFPDLTAWQEQYLVNLVYSRPEAWTSWRNSQADRPVRSLLHLVWLAMRGIVIVALGLLGVLPTRDRTPPALKEGKRKPAVAASIALVSCMVLMPARAEAWEVPETTATPEAPPAHPAAFHDEYEIGNADIALRDSGATHNVFFRVPVMKVISSATFKLQYAAPMLLPGEARLELILNGTLAGTVTLTPGNDMRAEVTLPTDLLASDNTLSFRLEGRCDACQRTRVPWVTLRPTSLLSFSGTRLPLANDLSLLPVPFFDSVGGHPWSLPVVFADSPDVNTLEAAAIVASWFGVFSDVRGVRFPTSIGRLPDGNAVVFMLLNSDLARGLALPQQGGPLIAIRDNPRDPFGKLLILAGGRPEDLVSAARALVTRNNAQAHVDLVTVRDPEIQLAEEYAAPRWLRVDQPASIGTYTTADRFELKGSGSINIYFRLPPDLFLQARQSVPLLLKFKYGGVTEGSHAALYIQLNGKDVDSIRLRPAASLTDEAEIVRLPTGRLQPYTNTLTVYFDFGNSQNSVRQYALIHRDSWLDLRTLPHSVLLPRLELFAAAGYPFTQWPDLGRTAVVFPDAPADADYEALLDMVGFFGSQTGQPGTALTVVTAAHVASVADKDLVIIGSPAAQPLLAEWGNSMPLQWAGDHASLNMDETAFRWLRPQWPLVLEDSEKLAAVLAGRRTPDVVVAEFVSPLRNDRSVVAIVPHDARGADAISALFMPSVRQGPVYGAVSVSQAGRFQSFLLSGRAYHEGRLSPYQEALVFIVEHYWLTPVLALAFAFMLGSWLRRRVEQVAVRRLAAART